MELAVHRLEYGLSSEQVDWRRWEPFASPLLSKHRLLTRPLMRFPETERFSVARFLPEQWHLFLADPLGYSVPFLSHVRPGMLAAWLGVVLVLLGLASDPALGLAATRRGLALSACTALAALAFPLFLRGMAEAHLLGANRATLAGADREALQHLRRAGAWYPPLHGSWSHRAEIGRALRRLGVDADPEALCAVAQEQLAEMRPQDALIALRHAAAAESGESLPPFFLGFTLVEAGVRSFANGQYCSAARHWEEALRILPTDPLPWCGLALVHLRHGDAARAASCLERVVHLQGYVGFKRLTLRSQTHVLWSWAALQEGELEDAHQHFAASLRPDMW
jgi:tetratricopeptide (TPR) repeat protein